MCKPPPVRPEAGLRLIPILLYPARTEKSNGKIAPRTPLVFFSGL